MDDDEASTVLESIIPNLENEDYEDLNSIVEAIAYDKSLCLIYGIDYINVTENWNKVKLASYYELMKTRNVLEISNMHRKNIIIREVNEKRSTVLKSAA